MEFTKNKLMYLIVTLIVIVVYNVVVFTIPFSRGGGFWTGYSFSMIAILLTVAVSFYAVIDRGTLRSKVYGVPLVYVVFGYLITQIVVGILEMIVSPYIPFQYGIALNTILLGACLIGLITVNIGKEEIESIDEKTKEKTFFIRSLHVDISCLIDKVSDDSVKKILKELSETVRYSDPMSSPQLAAIENKIETKAAMLAEAVDQSDNDSVKALCNELQQLFAERNRKCKILK